MPRIIVQTLQGRSKEQKRELCRRLTEVVVEVWKARPDGVSIFIEEVGSDNLARGGVLMSDRESTA